MRMAGVERAGESSRCEDPAPTVGIAGRPLRGMPHRPSFYIHADINWNIIGG